ncbi:MAG: phage tail protein [Chloroflexi bacterium]|nr:phage tail protein [Chloroflexota bacterium]
MASERVEMHGAFSFVVQIDGIDNASFSECTLPTLEVEIEEEKEGGFNDGTHLLPGRVRRGTMTLKRGITTDSALLKWYLDVLQGQLSNALRQVSVIMFDAEQHPVLRWDFKGAFPQKWTGPSLNTSNSALAIESLELAYESLTVT